MSDIFYPLMYLCVGDIKQFCYLLIIILVMFQTVIYDFDTFFLCCLSVAIFHINLRFRIIVLRCFKIIILQNPASDSFICRNFIFNCDLFNSTFACQIGFNHLLFKFFGISCIMCFGVEDIRSKCLIFYYPSSYSNFTNTNIIGKFSYTFFHSDTIHKYLFFVQLIIFFIFP